MAHPVYLTRANLILLAGACLSERVLPGTGRLAQSGLPRKPRRNVVKRFRGGLLYRFPCLLCPVWDRFECIRVGVVARVTTAFPAFVSVPVRHGGHFAPIAGAPDPSPDPSLGYRFLAQATDLADTELYRFLRVVRDGHVSSFELRAARTRRLYQWRGDAWTLMDNAPAAAIT